MPKLNLKLKSQQFLDLQKLRDEGKLLVCAIQPGPAFAMFRGKQVFISEEMIADLVPLVEEHPIMFANHEDRDTREPHIDTVSWVVDGTVRLAKKDEFDGIPKGSLIAEVEFSQNPNTKWMYEDLIRKPDLFELSISSMVTYDIKKINKQEFAVATAALAHMSIDWVDMGAAGGVVIAASKSLDAKEMTKEQLMEKIQIKEKWESKFEGIVIDDLFEKVPVQFGIKDNIDRRVLADIGFFLLDFAVDVIFFTDLSFDEMEVEIAKAIDTVFEMVKDMDILAMFGISEEARIDASEMQTAINFIQSKFKDKEIQNVPLGEVFSGFVQTGEDFDLTPYTVTYSNTQTEEDELLTKEEILKALRSSPEDEQSEILQEFASTEALEDEIASLKTTAKENDVKLAEFAKAEEAREAAKVVEVEIVELKTEMEIAVISEPIMAALRALPTKDARKELLLDVNSTPNSLILLDTDLTVEKEGISTNGNSVDDIVANLKKK